MPAFDASDGVRIAWREEGEGRPILLVHGFASNARVNWFSTSWTSALTEAGYRIIAPDLRGHGDSGKPHDTASYGIERLARDQGELLDHLGLGAVVTMGYSLGGRIAAHLAVMAPERVSALIIGGLGDQLIKGFPKAGAVADALRAESDADVTDPVAQGFRTFAGQTGGDLLALAACMEAGRANLTGEDLNGLSMPVLIAVGEEDEVAGDPQKLAAAIPGAELALIPRRDHMRAVGDKVHKKAVLEFLGRLARG
ncbi:alpha/beta fold hydrolase [Afifella sp. IM 167]|uniref:alpha/beta fold hydrolase n=1 Tax=Afifella sp. IM 167 TaxID=2033586 RepID=UPI001CCA463F|nr:alpha/beta hydrolase [Afifella sp. IM 167]